jgi:DinB superfamily
MKYDLNKSIEVLERTPTVLKALLNGISDDWTMNNEGPETFSPYDVAGHLIHAEKTNWPERIHMILAYGTTKTFEDFDRFAMYENSKGKSITQLLEEFEVLRKNNIQWFRELKLKESDLDKMGLHPKLGEVKLRQLLSSWVVHDLSHIAQIARIMAKQYKKDVGQWKDFFRLLDF